MFVAVAVVAAWLAYQAQWVHERRLLVENHEVAIFATDDGTPPRAPSTLWLFGEKGAGNITLQLVLDEKPKPGQNTDLTSLPLYARAQRAFPEAKIRGLRTSWPSKAD
jgi:hypothetical protein